LLYTFDDDGRPRYKSRRDRPAVRNPLRSPYTRVPAGRYRAAPEGE
jgi:hypothetical protein